MNRNFRGLLLSTAIAFVSATAAQAQTAPADEAADAGGINDIIVTAQKREQNINKVGMAITAQSGDELLSKGIVSVADLAKVVPGFTFEGAAGNAPIYSIRGVGFHDLSLASGQAVAVYADETPIPFGYETIGVDFDVARVEVLKGPQGTLFGQNSTGGAINYVMAKPTANLEYGLNLTYGRFNTTDISGFVSGPLSDTLRARVAVRSIQGDGWQKRYGPVPNQLQGPADDTIGRQNQLAGRILLEWRPTSDFKVLLNLNTRRDRSDTQVPQFNGLRPSSSQPVVPEILAFPLPPQDNRAAAWDPGIDYAQNNRWTEASARIEYDAGAATITSLTAYQRYKRNAPAREHDATPYPALRYGYRGDVETFYQELRAGGTFGGQGSWLVGANYEDDKTEELFHTYNPLATSRLLFGLPNLSSGSLSNNQMKTYGIFGNVEYPIAENLSLQAGARYTKADRKTQGCSLDDGGLAAIFTVIQTNLVNAGVKKTPIVTPPPGGCVTLDATATPGLFKGELNEDNVSWRVGLNWTAAPGTLFYVNASKGCKAGSYPLVAATSYVQYTPVPQESLLAFEAGVKSRLTPNVQFNASAFYYDYTDKQIGGIYIDPVFGRLTKLVTVPESRVYGFEATLDWRPIQGLTINPSVSYVNSRIQGTFSNYTPTGVLKSFVGEAFPYSPEWQANANIEYKWNVSSDWSAFVGGNIAYHGKTNGAFGQIKSYEIKDYTLVDLRAGVESDSGRYRLFAWGTNVFNEYYWMTAARNFDSDARNMGQPARYGVTFSYRFN
ncbi:MAG TPA: TonB-dependent receptor [Novosphingobium sp.]|nr:TonB-dependent receptor [Novosphingobium sp.]HPZ46368.1 TonB-dependent receptor [Novosphingobium sp.]HQD98736.1 TonB-dependent receptor [Novosphingobium sp.]